MPRISNPSIEQLLTGGDRRTVKGVTSALRLVRRAPARVPELVQALRSGVTGVPMRAADALEKLSRERSDLLIRHRRQLLAIARRTDDHTVRWNLVQVLTRLPAGKRATIALGRRLRAWFLTDDSVIVRVCALEGIVALASREPRLQPMVQQLLAEARSSGSAAIRARARHLQA